jgi:hypothetical protein
MLVDRTRFPCWTCTKPQAIDARAWLASADQADFESKLSPLGRPLMCCLVHVAAVMPGEVLSR